MVAALKVVTPQAGIRDANQIRCRRCGHVMEHISEDKEYKNRETYVCPQCHRVWYVVDELHTCSQCYHCWGNKCRCKSPDPVHGFPTINPHTVTCGEFKPFWEGQL